MTYTEQIIWDLPYRVLLLLLPRLLRQLRWWETFTNVKLEPGVNYRTHIYYKLIL